MDSCKNHPQKTIEVLVKEFPAAMRRISGRLAADVAARPPSERDPILLITSGLIAVHALRCPACQAYEACRTMQEMVVCIDIVVDDMAMRGALGSAVKWTTPGEAQ